MPRRGNRERMDPEFLRKCEEQIAALMRGEGYEPFFAAGQPSFVKPKKGSVKFTACETANCTGLAHHETNKFLRWFWQPNSFYCWPCQISRGLIVAALAMAAWALLLLPMATWPR